MSRSYLLIGVLILATLFAISPVHAFTAKNLDIAIQPDTSADITFTYELSWYENIAVFARIADPATELKKALTSQFDKPVDVVSVSGSSVEVRVQNFAARKVTGDSVTLKTPSLSFQNAENALKQYWFAPLISPDFSPDVTTVSFPDGYAEKFYNQVSIPAVSHVLSS
jgi:hypothetical protein